MSAVTRVVTFVRTTGDTATAEASTNEAKNIYNEIGIAQEDPTRDSLLKAVQPTIETAELSEKGETILHPITRLWTDRGLAGIRTVPRFDVEIYTIICARMP